MDHPQKAYPLPDDLCTFIKSLAVDHPDPEREQWEGEQSSYGGDLLIRVEALALRFPPGTNVAFLTNVLYGLKKADISSELKIEVVRRVVVFEDNACAKAALDVLGSVKRPRAKATVASDGGRCFLPTQLPGNDVYAREIRAD